MAKAEKFPEGARAQFVTWLREAQQREAGREGASLSLKAMATELGISPTRLSEFLRPANTMNANFLGKDFGSADLANLRKAVSGFSYSVQRTCDWLIRKDVDLAKKITPTFVTSVVRGFLADQWRDAKYAGDVSSYVENGIQRAKDESENDPQAVIRVQVVAWEPFACLGEIERKQDDIKNYGFLGAYARALVEQIDPKLARIEASSIRFEEALQLSASDRTKGRNAALGFYDILYRRFRGFQLVTFPAIRVPLMGLVISASGETVASDDDDAFERLFGATPKGRVFTIDSEVGDLFIRSAAENDNGIESLPPSASGPIAPAVAVRLEKEAAAEPSGSIAFLSDAILAFEVFAELSRRRRAHVDVVAPHKDDEEALSFSIGFMLRDEDADFASLLSEAQKQFLSVPWQAEPLFEEFFRGVEAWVARNAPPDHAKWPERAKVFRFGRERLNEVLASPKTSERFESLALNWKTRFLGRVSPENKTLLKKLLWEKQK